MFLSLVFGFLCLPHSYWNGRKTWKPKWAGSKFLFEHLQARKVCLLFLHIPKTIHSRFFILWPRRVLQMNILDFLFSLFEILYSNGEIWIYVIETFIMINYLVDVCKIVGLKNNSINTSSQQSNLSIQTTEMNWTETRYMTGLPILAIPLPSTLTFNFDIMHSRNEDYFSN